MYLLLITNHHFEHLKACLGVFSGLTWRLNADNYYTYFFSSAQVPSPSGRFNNGPCGLATRSDGRREVVVVAPDIAEIFDVEELEWRTGSNKTKFCCNARIGHAKISTFKGKIANYVFSSLKEKSSSRS